MNMFEFFLLFLFIHNRAHGKLPQCFEQVCDFGNSKDPTKYFPCEPPDSNFNIASIAKITIEPSSATCGTTAMKICSLQNPFSCPYVCDNKHDATKHGPMMMVDGVKWTWWQSTVSPSSNYPINITFSLRKTFVLTDDITIHFRDGFPDAMIVEKSSDNGKSWSPLQYFASNCYRQFKLEAIESLMYLNMEEAVLPFCTEQYSVNIDGKKTNDKVTVAILQRITALRLNQDIGKKEICSHLYSDGILKSFLQITDFRIRLLRSPLLRQRGGNIRKELGGTRHYGIKKVFIAGRCQCNGHAGQCNIADGNAVCQCRHNTFGGECQKCKPLFWMRPWKPATFEWKKSTPKANPCLTYYSTYYRQKWLIDEPLDRLKEMVAPRRCDCNQHSERCTIIERVGTVCVDCRHNTEGQNCHLCKRAFYRMNGTATTDPHSCKACNCDVIGSWVTWCQSSGFCRCKVNYTGRRCDRCVSSYIRKPGKECVRLTDSLCCNQLCRQWYCSKLDGKKTRDEEVIQRANPLLTLPSECRNIRIKQCRCSEFNLQPQDCKRKLIPYRDSLLSGGNDAVATFAASSLTLFIQINCVFAFYFKEISTQPGGFPLFF